MKKNKGFFKEVTKGKAPFPKYIYEGEAKPSKAQKQPAVGVEV